MSLFRNIRPDSLLLHIPFSILLSSLLYFFYLFTDCQELFSQSEQKTSSSGIQNRTWGDRDHYEPQRNWWKSRNQQKQIESTASEKVKNEFNQQTLQAKETDKIRRHFQFFNGQRERWPKHTPEILFKTKVKTEIFRCQECYREVRPCCPESWKESPNYFRKH